MATSQLPDSISILLGPPARPDERAKFDRYQAEQTRPAEERDKDFCAFYERLMESYLADLAVGDGAGGSASLIEQVFEAALGVPIRIARQFVGFAFIRGLRTYNLHFQWSDLLTPTGPLPTLSSDDLKALGSAVGYALKLDWVVTQQAWRAAESKPARRRRARRTRAGAGAR